MFVNFLTGVNFCGPQKFTNVLKRTYKTSNKNILYKTTLFEVYKDAIYKNYHGWLMIIIRTKYVSYESQGGILTTPRYKYHPSPSHSTNNSTK